MVIILMGVAGSGKTTIGRLMAQRLGWPFHDADDFQPTANLEKMKRGVALSDEDRAPWLAAIRALIVRYLNSGVHAIVACSALKQAYRQQLAVERERVKFVYLSGPPALIAERLAHRRGHFFAPELLDSQFRTLEKPCGVLTVDVSPPSAVIVDTIIAAMRL